MKRVVASVLLLIFVLNVFGYYGVFMGVRFHATQKIRNSFDFDDYQHGSEVTFKVPLTLPYASDMDEYERVDGEFNYQGDTYRLVKQRLTRDTLNIVCVKDTHSNRIDKALEDYVKTFADSPSSEKNHSKSAPSLTKDYFSTTITVEKRQSGWEYSIPWSEFRLQKVTSFKDSLLQPPQS